MSLQSLQKLRRVLIWMKPTNTWLSPLNSNVSASSVSESYSWVKFANFNIHLPRTETGSRKAIYSNLNLTLFWIWVPPIFYESLWEKWDTIHVLFHVCLLLWGAVLSIQFWHVLAVKLYEYVSLVGTFEFTVFGRVLPRKKKNKKHEIATEWRTLRYRNRRYGVSECYWKAETLLEKMHISNMKLKIDLTYTQLQQLRLPLKRYWLILQNKWSTDKRLKQKTKDTQKSTQPKNQPNWKNVCLLIKYT